MLPAAWRKMWVSRAVGTAPEATSSANGLPAPTGASWSASPTSTTCVSARPRAAASPAARGSPSRSRRRSADRTRAGPPRRGSGPRRGSSRAPSARSGRATPLASLIRIAARPVGATSITRAPWPAATRGDRPDRRGLAGARAARDQRQPVRERVADAGPLLGGRARARVGVPRSSPGGAQPAARRRRARRSSAHPLGQLGLELGGLRPVDPLLRRAPGRRARPARRSNASCATASRRAARAAPPAARRAACRCCRRARPRTARAARRRGRARGRRPATPTPRAIRSAIRKPTPNTLVSSYGRSLTTRCAVAVLGVDPLDQVREPVRREQQVQLPRHAQPSQEAAASLGALPRRSPTAANAASRVAVDRVEHARRRRSARSASRRACCRRA